MQTGNANINLNNYDKQTTSQVMNQTTAINQTTRLTNSPISNEQMVLSELTKGEILKGEVIDLRGTDLQLLLSDGQTLKASFESTLPLYIGDSASFFVEEVTKESLHLRLLPAEYNTTTDATIDKALEEAGLPKSDKNITVVQELLKNGLSIDKKSIINLLRQSAMFRSTSIETLAIMNKHQIPVNEQNTSQFEAYRNYEFRLMEQAKQLTQSITTVFQNLPSDSELFNQFISLFHNASGSEDLNLTNVNTNENNFNMTSLNSNDDNFSMTQLNPKEGNANTTPLNPDGSTTLSSDLTNAANTQGSTAIPQEIPYDQGTTHALKSPVADHQAGSEVPSTDSLLETILKNEFTLPLHKLTQPNSISKFYEKLEQDLEKIQSFFSQHAAAIAKEEKETILSQTSNVKDNIDFMKTLNQLFGYVQLPMKLPNKNVHSELFVYTNKKKLKEGNQQVSVLLHLDMTHLGPIDFHLSLINHQVTAKISMEDLNSMELIEQHLPELSSALEAKGYHMTYQMEKLEKKTKVIRDAFENNSCDLLMRRYSFDLRA